MRDESPEPGTEPTARTLYVGTGFAAVGGVDPTQRALLVDGDTIVWTGQPEHAPEVDEVVDLGAVWLTPGFVDAHVHGTATGMLEAGLDLSGAGSAAEVLDLVRAAAETADQVIYGAGWDDLTWPVDADGRRRPTAAQLAGVAPGHTVVLVRTDGHSCLADQQTLRSLDLSSCPQGVEVDTDGEPTGWLREQASGIALSTMRASLSQAQLTLARATAAALGVSRGITAFHEMGIPELTDKSDTVAWATGDHILTVHAYWAELDIDPAGVLRPGGDLFLDGSIGSCTAATVEPYKTTDGDTTSGELFNSDEVVADFFTAATIAGVGAGVHAIGDRAVAQAVWAITEAARRCGRDAVRRARHRIEHVEMASLANVRTMGELGVVASVQPAFDARWNGPDGLYERRFGRTRADATNPLSWFADAGVAMCFSSDSTVTPIDPWGGVLSAGLHHGGHSVSRAVALDAATIGGSRVLGIDGQVGALTPGRRADVAAWPGDPLADDPRAWDPSAVICRGVRRL